MEWLVLCALILIGTKILKWLTEKCARKLETTAPRNIEANIFRLEPSARLPEVNTTTYNFQGNKYILSQAKFQFL